MKKPLLIISGLLFFLFSFSFVEAQTYVKSESCKACHPTKYTDWEASGHPYKFNVIENDQAPTYPAEAVNYQSTWLANLGDGTHDWSDIAGVIGGYGWKARFVGKDGHLIGTFGSSYDDAGMGQNQINFWAGEDLGWADYHPNDVKIYNYGCFKCHTTGGDTTGTWLAGVDGLGTFSEGGIGCEACHGPGSDHIAAPTKANIDKVYEQVHQDNSVGGLETYGVLQTPDPDGDDINFMCGSCHNRGYTNIIDASGGFVKHHEQWDEMTTTRHGEIGLTCITCHDPHKRVIWDGDGIIKNCTECHTTQAATTNHGPGASCIDCHMPFAAKSGAKRGASGYVGDVRSHLLVINTDTANMFTADGKAVRDDADRSAALSPRYSCMGCHNNDPGDNIPDQTIMEASAAAYNMHGTVNLNPVAKKDISVDVFPNPAISYANISVTLINASTVGMKIYNASGKLIYEGPENFLPAGKHAMTWNAVQDVPSGVYFIKVQGNEVSALKKFVLTK